MGGRLVGLSEALHQLHVPHIGIETQNDELRMLRQSLDDARSHYRELFHHAPVAMLVLDTKGRVLQANDPAAELLAETPERLVGLELQQWMSSEDAARFSLHLNTLAAASGRGFLEVEVGAAPRRRVRIVCIPASIDGRAEVRCILADLPKARASSGGSLTQAVLDRVSDGFVGLDGEGRIEWVNRAAERLLGQSAAELAGRPLHELVPELDRGSEGLHSREVVSRQRDGSPLLLEIRFGSWSDGDTTRWLAVLRDLYEARRPGPDVPQAGLDKLHGPNHGVDAVLYIREPDGQLSFVSPACLGMWGVPPAELCANPEAWFTAIHPADRPAARRAAVDLLKIGWWDEPWRIRHADGTQRWVRDRAFVVRDDDGQVVCTVGVVHDVTHERQQQIEREQARKLEALGALAGGVAHDFANLMMGIAGCADLAARDPSSPDAAELIEEIARGAQRGATLSRKLLGFSRRRDVEVRPISADEAVRDTARFVERLLGNHIRLELRLSGGCILADGVQIDQLIMNLATNARDAMPEGGVLTIETTQLDLDAEAAARLDLPRDNYLRIDVKDNGRGMDQATLARALDPFFTTKPDGRGTGLGLSTARSISGELRGTLTLSSKPGYGTCASVYLPLCDIPSESSMEPPDDLPPHRRVLLVEDEPLVRRTIRHLLELLGQTVLEAEGPEDALAICDREPIDVLLTDVALPGLTGPRLAARVHLLQPRARTLLMSAHPHLQLVEVGTVQADVPFLQKPFDLEGLAAGLRDLLAQT